MKLFERISYILFWINILFVIFTYVGLPVLFITVQNFFGLFMENQGRNPLYISLSILSIGTFLHWGYCIWFLFKYDRYSRSIFPLFFLSVIYAPIYYYRVKIKKRPLRNKINKQKSKELDSGDNSISEKEFIRLNRENIIGVLKLWSASKYEQLEYQKKNSDSQFSNELFEQWKDFYVAGSDVMTEAFNKNELDLLNNFDSELNNIEKRIKGKVSLIEEFITTSDWEKLHLLAQEVLVKLK